MALFLQQGHEAPGLVGLQPLCRIISQDDGRVGGQSPGQGHALLFGQGQLVGPPFVEEPVL